MAEQNGDKPGKKRDVMKWIRHRYKRKATSSVCMKEEVQGPEVHQTSSAITSFCARGGQSGKEKASVSGKIAAIFSNIRKPQATTEANVFERPVATTIDCYPSACDEAPKMKHHLEEVFRS